MTESEEIEDRYPLATKFIDESDPSGIQYLAGAVAASATMSVDIHNLISQIERRGALLGKRHYGGVDILRGLDESIRRNVTNALVTMEEVLEEQQAAVQKIDSAVTELYSEGGEIR